MAGRALRLGCIAAALIFAAPPLSGCSRPVSKEAASAPEVSDIQAALVAETGYPSDKVELKIDQAVVTITIVNSPLVSATTLDREHEARRMVETVVRTAHGKPAYSAVHTIHIDYVTRKPDGSGTRTVDAIDFRKDQQDVFQNHRT